MKAAWLSAAFLALAAVTSAKSPTARIEVLRGKNALVTLTGAEQAGRFTIWSGPGTSMTSVDGTTTTPTTARDFADWAAGPVEAPRNLEVFSVRFYCAAAGETPNESVPSHFCYGVRYAYPRSGERGYIQIPAAHDPEFPMNGQSIYRGVEGSWFRASEAWDDIVRDRLESARAAEVRAQRDASYPEFAQVFIEKRPAPRATSATPKVTPKPR
jgi:hypothetical protein